MLKEGGGIEKIKTRRAFLKQMAAAAVVQTSLFGRVWGREQVLGEASLQERASKKGLIYGAAVGFHPLKNDSGLAGSLVRECGVIVPEGALKWDTLRPEADKFDFTQADYMFDFARKNNLLFRGHTLVWHEALPKWLGSVVTGNNAEQILLSHIAEVVGRYAGKIHSWDVVNEPVAPWDNQPDAMRNTPWFRLLGQSYIDIAFNAAKEADPNAMLMLNMNHVEYGKDVRTRSATLKLLSRMKKSGTPVHALGIQGHLNMEGESFNPKAFRAFLGDVAGLGIKIMITELDVADNDFPKDIHIRDRMVADRYEEFLSAALDERAVIGVLTWGLSDKFTWLSKVRPRTDKAAVRTLPLDDNFDRKLAWKAIARAFDNAPNR
ncbi:MAG: endo-1,4-beta-xylanase [Candidatus Magnetominusculus sp. LBB02]|nr:endo-1,4-beta-xylanase [Candidatus Magnetominusculus sp. LBB02]